MELASAKPPPLRTPVRWTHARAAAKLLNESEWVGPTAPSEYRTRGAAASAAQRMIAAVQEVEPDPPRLERRIWQEGSRWRWAIRRVP